MSDSLSRCRLLKIDQVAELTNTSRPTIYRWIAAGKLPAVRKGRLVRVREVDLIAFIEGGASTEKVIPIRSRRESA
jgi:excisionase family DNA binding protein